MKIYPCDKWYQSCVVIVAGVLGSEWTAGMGDLEEYEGIPTS